MLGNGESRVKEEVDNERGHSTSGLWHLSLGRSNPSNNVVTS